MSCGDYLMDFEERNNKLIAIRKDEHSKNPTEVEQSDHPPQLSNTLKNPTEVEQSDHPPQLSPPQTKWHTILTRQENYLHIAFKAIRQKAI